jgi:excisionase family DNA binding protein
VSAHARTDPGGTGLSKMDERYAFTVHDFCRWSGIGRSKTYDLIAAGELPILKVGTKTLIRVDDAKAFLDGRVGSRMSSPVGTPTAGQRVA